MELVALHSSINLSPSSMHRRACIAGLTSFGVRHASVWSAPVHASSWALQVATRQSVS